MGSFRQSQGTTALGRGEFPLVAVIRWESSRGVSDHANPPGLLDDEVLVVLLGAIEWCSRSLCRAVPRVGGRRGVKQPSLHRGYHRFLRRRVVPDRALVLITHHRERHRVMLLLHHSIAPRSTTRTSSSSRPRGGPC